MRDQQIGFWGMLITVVLIYLLRGFLGGLSALFFVHMDNLLLISTKIPPVMMWAIFGLSLGPVYGAFVAIKKHRLGYRHLIFPIGAFAAVISLILLAAYFVNA